MKQKYADVGRIKRDQYLMIKVSAEEKNTISRAADIRGETMSNYVRRTLIEHALKEG